MKPIKPYMLVSTAFHAFPDCGPQGFFVACLVAMSAYPDLINEQLAEEGRVIYEELLRTTGEDIGDELMERMMAWKLAAMPIMEALADKGNADIDAYQAQIAVEYALQSK